MSRLQITAVLLLLYAPTACVAPPPEYSFAQHFILVDKDWQPRGAFTQNVDTTELAIFQPNRTLGAALTVGKASGLSVSGAVLADANGKKRMILAVFDGVSAVLFLDENGKATKVVAADKWGNPAVVPVVNHSLDAIEKQIERGDWLQLLRAVDKQAPRRTP